MSTRLIELIDQFIGDKEVKVYRMVTDTCEKNEFDWEQLYFQVDTKVYVLDFYQWG